MTPTIGRTVHYIDPYSKITFAAIITEANQDGTADLVVFNTTQNPPIQHVKSVPQADIELHAHGAWHWPRKVEEAPAAPAPPAPAPPVPQDLTHLKPPTQISETTEQNPAVEAEGATEPSAPRPLSRRKAGKEAAQAPVVEQPIPQSPEPAKEDSN